MRKKWKQWQIFFLGSKITANGDCSHKIKRLLLLGRKNLDSILKSRDITWPTKVHLVKAIIFLVVIYWCEIWTIKKAEPHRSDAFKLCWRRLLRVLWTARGSNQSIPKEINPEYSLEGLRLKLKLQYFGHLMRRAISLEKTDWCWSWSFNTLATWCEEPFHWKRPWCWERLKAKWEEGDRGWDG